MDLNKTTNLDLQTYNETDNPSFLDYRKALNDDTNSNMTKIDEFAGTVLVSLFEETNATLTTNWVGASAPYTQSISVPGITANDRPVIMLEYSSTHITQLLEKEAWGFITFYDTYEDSIVFTCIEYKPTIELNIIVKGV